MSTPPSKFFNRYEFDEDVRDENVRLRAVNGQLLAALEALTLRHAELVNSGDCGFWDVEQEPAMLQARAAIAEAQKATGGQ